MAVKSGFVKQDGPDGPEELRDLQKTMSDLGFTPDPSTHTVNGTVTFASEFKDAKNCKVVLRDEFTTSRLQTGNINARTMEIFDEGQKVMVLRYEKSAADDKFHFISTTYPAGTFSKNDITVKAPDAGKAYTFDQLQDSAKLLTSNIHYYAQSFLKMEQQELDKEARENKAGVMKPGGLQQ
jgi:hypothetical protein